MKTYVAEINFAPWKQENIFASGQKHFCFKFPEATFSSIRNIRFPGAMLTSFQYCSLKMFPRNGEHTTMADSEVEVKSKGHKRVIEKGKERRKNCKDRKIELLIALYEVRGLFVGCSL